MSTQQLTQLERAVLTSAVAQAGDLADALRAQLDAAQVAVRTPSGVGFVTKLEVPAGLSLVDQQVDAGLPTITGKHPQLPSGAEFVLQIKDGLLNSIEAFCYEGMWPADESSFRLDVKG